MISRTPPYNEEAEHGVLSSMMIDWETVGEIKGFLNEDDFYVQSHRIIYKHICKLYDEGKPIDILIHLTESLRQSRELDDAGHVAGLMGVMDAQVTAAYYDHYAHMVKEKSLLRKHIKVLEKALQKTYDAQEKFLDIATTTQNEIAELMVDGVASLDLEHVSEHIEEISENIQKLYDNEGMIGTKTGLVDLDKKIGGFQNQQLVIIAARPSMGKTALMLKFALTAAKAGKSVGIFSLEMSPASLGQRMVSMISNVSLAVGEYTDKDKTLIKNAIEKYENLPIHIGDVSNISIDSLIAKATAFKQRHGLDVIFVDYLQLMDFSGAESNQLGVSRASKGLKSLARTLGVPVIVLSQLSRAVESRTDKRPILSDLRDSGAIEQDADVVMFIYRDEYYNSETKDKNIAEINVAKQRNGATGKIHTHFATAKTLFSDLDYKYG